MNLSWNGIYCALIFLSVGVVSLPETELFSGNKGTVQVCATLSADVSDTTVHAISISLTARDGTGEPLLRQHGHDGCFKASYIILVMASYHTSSKGCMQIFPFELRKAKIRSGRCNWGNVSIKISTAVNRKLDAIP